MVHIGSAPRIEEVVPLFRKDDVITHYLNGKENNLFDEEGKPLPVLLDAVKRGVHLDVGHGNASFSFKVAEARSVTISSLIRLVQIFTGRIHIPYSMAHVLSKFLYLGYPLEEVIDAVTKMQQSG